MIIAKMYLSKGTWFYTAIERETTIVYFYCMEIKDQLGKNLVFNSPPQRIISVVPSQTELLYDLGLDKEVIGITKFCIHPGDWFRTKTRIGGTKKLNIEKIKELNPDLIIANKEENAKDQIYELQNHFPVWISDIKTIDQSLQMILSVGQITGTESKALEIIKKIEAGLEKLNSCKKTNPLHRMVYLIWREPYMTINEDTFIHHLLGLSGFTNLFSKNDKRYPETSLEEINSLNPGYVFLSSEPFPFREKHKKEVEKKVTHAKVVLVDGEAFSWYGSRLITSCKYLQNLMNSLT